MAEQLKELIEKIRQEGIQAADQKANQILASANSKAEALIQKAKTDAQGIVNQANQEAARIKEVTDATLRQAGRDLLLKLRQEIDSLLKKIILAEIRGALSADEMVKIISKLIESYEDAGSSIVVSVSEQDLDKVKKSLMGKLTGQLKKGITLESKDEVAGGFIISYDGNKSHLDFTDKALADYLSGSLEPELAKILKES